MNRYHPSLANARFEVDPGLEAKGTPIGLAGWDAHVVQLVGFDVPMPAEVVEYCVQPAHYGPELKQRARQHKAHLLLYYAGFEPSPLEQYVALATVAGALAAHGALIVLNESAHTSFPAEPLASGTVEGDAIENLRSLPLLILFCGFVKLEGEFPGVWTRTYGNHLLGLPDLAHHVQGHHQGQDTFDMFSNILNYLLDSKAKFSAGHTMQVGENSFLRLRAPRRDEGFLQSEGEMFVTELISETEINRW